MQSLPNSKLGFSLRFPPFKTVKGHVIVAPTHDVSDLARANCRITDFKRVHEHPVHDERGIMGEHDRSESPLPPGEG